MGTVRIIGYDTKVMLRPFIVLCIVLNLGVSLWWLLHSEVLQPVTASDLNIPQNVPQLQIISPAAATAQPALAPAATSPAPP